MIIKIIRDSFSRVQRQCSKADQADPHPFFIVPGDTVSAYQTAVFIAPPCSISIPEMYIDMDVFYKTRKMVKVQGTENKDFSRK